MKSVLKYPGAKWNIAGWIINNFPPGYEKMTYLEPFFGSGAIMFNKKRSKIETINDLDSRVVNLFKVIRDEPEKLSRLIEYTPWSREEYLMSYEVSEDPIEDARRFIVRLWQGIGAKTSDITGWSNNIKPVDTGKARWSRLSVDIKVTADRLRNQSLGMVQIENSDAMKLIERHNSPDVFMYLDPPYPLGTRSKRHYKHEMCDKNHEDLLAILKDSKAMIMVSSYDNELYDQELKGWFKKSISATTEFGGSAEEVIWMNYEPPMEQLKLF